MIPDVSDALVEWESPYTIRTETRTTVDFVESVSVVTRTQLCVVQPADKNKLSTDTIDWSLGYQMVHSRFALSLNEIIEYNGRDYIIKELLAYGDYGYWEVIAEEIK